MEETSHSAIKTGADFRGLYPKVDISRATDILSRRVEAEIHYRRDKDLPNVLLQAVQNMLTTASSGNWGASMVEKPKPLFVWEIIRAMSVASQCKLSTISFGESKIKIGPPPEERTPGGTIDGNMLLREFEEKLKKGGTYEMPSEFTMRKLSGKPPTWQIVLLIEMKDVKDERNIYPLISKLVNAWQVNARYGFTGPVRGCLTTFEKWWFCEFNPAEDCSVEAPSGTILTRNPLDFGTIEMPSEGATPRWEFVPYAGVMDVIGILRDTALPEVVNFRKCYSNGLDCIFNAAKKGVSRAKTFYQEDKPGIFSWLKSR